MEPEKGKNMMQGAMEKVPPASQLEIVKTAHKHRIDENEPAWVLVELAMEAVGGVEKIAQSLREASVKVTEATRDEVKSARDKAAIEIGKMQETAKTNIAGALGTILETEIREAVSRLQSQSNRPLHKKWLIAMGAGILIAAGLGGWGVRDFSKHEERVGEAKMSAFMGSADFPNLMQCNNPGWITKWVGAGKEKKLACYPYADKKSGNLFGWQIP
ncbi:MAG: hypothetical protein VST70_02440 [Nitrospirota bacterium]|nr:hypothetical protein [Nitrospirota bacterium]